MLQGNGKVSSVIKLPERGWFSWPLFEGPCLGWTLYLEKIHDTYYLLKHASIKSYMLSALYLGVLHSGLDCEAFSLHSGHYCARNDRTLSETGNYTLVRDEVYFDVTMEMTLN